MIVGITGGIGSGKSTIARELARRGYHVYDCDSEAKRIIAGDSAVQAAIINLLGEEAFIQGCYNTDYVSRRVFADPELLAGINSIVHPAVLCDIQRVHETIGVKAVLFVESAILFEAGIDHLCDRVVVVDAPEEIRIARTIERDFHGEATEDNINKVRARIHAQRASMLPSVKPYITATNDGSTSLVALVDSIVSQLFTDSSTN